jgi:FkbM family methyltransferase
MKIYYGNLTKAIDVTNICQTTLANNDIITIPSGDLCRAKHFSDPLIGIRKKIFIFMNDRSAEYNEFITIKLNLITRTIVTVDDRDINRKLKNIQSKLRIKYGHFNQELPEQKMAVRFLKGSERVLELGGNIGRNSLIIASILHDSTNLVSVECNAAIAAQLAENRDLNGFKFGIEKSALSNQKLIQKGWSTKPSDVLQDGYHFVSTITLPDLKNKYNIQFDTLVLDCEGAFYPILRDMPEILRGITLIIMENDYLEKSDKNFVDEILTENGFSVDYTERGGWGACMDNFFEVWIKPTVEKS